MDKNIVRDVDEQNNDIALETEKAKRKLWFCTFLYSLKHKLFNLVI